MGSVWGEGDMLAKKNMTPTGHFPPLHNTVKAAFGRIMTRGHSGDTGKASKRYAKS